MITVMSFSCWLQTCNELALSYKFLIIPTTLIKNGLYVSIN